MKDILRVGAKREAVYGKQHGKQHEKQYGKQHGKQYWRSHTGRGNGNGGVTPNCTFSCAADRPGISICDYNMSYERYYTHASRTNCIGKNKVPRSLRARY
ncbi:hypothetical protein POVWA2_024360 [Plasmodium ovale wallikeri]|uniref:Uncharacterized protein n=1 Tax=Plasmodium ovale wallikeri TaxID=864142 RepID=A0A1A8YT84_PLAOA|nr:hypothetical protein POVWA1_024480 [Plasmodium ovale wallikeri]SBT35293.1 hypothetical protein POVWA2_024360 [Plasmodium ovale wallikeri]